MQGYFGGWVDLGFQRFLEVWSSLPTLYLLIILASLIQPTFWILLGLLLLLAITSMEVYGIIIAGWASNSKYAFLGALRSSGQMISYEVAMGMSLIPVLLLSGNVSFDAIIAEQQLSLWFVGPLFVAFFIFLVSGFAETNRLPFDLPEAESELIAGYHSEYSAMKFSMFFIAEYANMVTVSAMVATLFLGGWDIPFTNWAESGTVPAGHPVLLITGAATRDPRAFDPRRLDRGCSTARHLVDSLFVRAGGQVVAHPVALGAQVPQVLRVGRDGQRHAVDHAQAVALEADHLARVVGDRANRAEAEIEQDRVRRARRCKP